MIDLHSHILPELDDGAQNLHQSLEMARIAIQSGVTAMVATPHCVDGQAEDVRSMLKLMRSVLRENGLRLQLCSGMEIFGTRDTARLLREYGMEKKCVVTSFSMDYIRNFKAVAPEFRVGYLTGEVTEETVRQLRQMDASEICPKAEDLTAEQVYRWHREGFRVRAWGVKNAEIMRHAFQCGVDGMTVNFPDLLTNLRKEQEAAGNG